MARPIGAAVVILFVLFGPMLTARPAYGFHDNFFDIFFDAAGSTDAAPAAAYFNNKLYAAVKGMVTLTST